MSAFLLFNQIVDSCKLLHIHISLSLGIGWVGNIPLLAQDCIIISNCHNRTLINLLSLLPHNHCLQGLIDLRFVALILLHSYFATFMIVSILHISAETPLKGHSSIQPHGLHIPRICESSVPDRAVWVSTRAISPISYTLSLLSDGWESYSSICMTVHIGQECATFVLITGLKHLIEPTIIKVDVGIPSSTIRWVLHSSIGPCEICLAGLWLRFWGAKSSVSVIVFVGVEHF